MANIIFSIYHRWPDRSCWLFFGCRTKKDVFYLDRYRELASKYPNFKVYYAFSDPLEEDEDWDGDLGFIHLDQVIEKFDPDVIRRIFNVRLKFDVDFDPEKNFRLIDTPVEELEGNDLLRAAVDYDEELIKLYKRIFDRDIGEEARQFIEIYPENLSYGLR